MTISNMYYWESSESGIECGLAEYQPPKIAIDKENAFFEKIDN